MLKTLNAHNLFLIMILNIYDRHKKTNKLYPITMIFNPQLKLEQKKGLLNDYQQPSI